MDFVLKAARGSLEHAIQVAVAAHAGAVCKAGRPQILHPLLVMVGVAVHGDEAMSAAVLHDVVEDTAWTLADLLDAGFAPAVVDAVGLLSRPPVGAPDRPTYREFIRAIRDSGNRMALAIKIQDIFDNLGRLHELLEAERGIAKRYREALEILGGEEDVGGPAGA
jgi:(p)ppGpp synthase/HD superfamily hydrolase